MDQTRAEKRLERIRKNRQCKKLPVDATKDEIKNAHRVKMAAKKIVRERTHEQFKADYKSYKEWIAEKANRLVTGRQHVL